MFPIYCRKIRLSFSETWQNDTFSLTFSSWLKDLWQISFSCQCVSTQPEYYCFHSFGVLFKKLENKLLVLKLNCKVLVLMLGLMTVDTEPMCPSVLCNIVFCPCSVNRTLNYNCPSSLKFVLVRFILRSCYSCFCCYCCSGSTVGPIAPLGPTINIVFLIKSLFERVLMDGFKFFLFQVLAEAFWSSIICF